MVLNFTNEDEYTEGASKIKDILNDVLTPGFSKDLIEGGINSTYDYLEGKTAKIQIEMDERNLEDAIVKVFDNFSKENLSTVEDLKKLPTCTPQEAEQLEEAASVTDVELTCIPESVDLDSITEDLLEQFGVQQKTEAGTIVQLIPTNFEFTNAQSVALKGGYNLIRITPVILFTIILALTLFSAILIPTTARVIIPSIIGISAACFSLAVSILLLVSEKIATFILSIIEIPYLTDFSGLRLLVETIIKDVAYRSIWISVALIIFYLLLILLNRYLRNKKANK